MYMTNKVTTQSLVLDSSILVEYSKGRKTELLEYLLEKRPTELFINSTVLSEYMFHWLGNNGGKAPRTLQQGQQIGRLLLQDDQHDFLSLFSILPSDNAIIPVYLSFMQQYNLLPNDALILASCKIHGIPALASYDPDFEGACAAENIRLVRQIEDLS